MTRVFIQARMSSSRFPGKVLAPFKGRPVITQLIRRIAENLPPDQIVVATSTEESDDPLVSYLHGICINTFRGPLEDVFERFRQCLNQYPCDWFFRVSGDSPLLDGKLLKDMLSYTASNADLVTNVQVRSFPRGQSVEMLKSGTFEQIDPAFLSQAEREHLTKYYYSHPNDFTIINLFSGNPSLTELNYCVDTLDDLRNLERSVDDDAVLGAGFRFAGDES